MPEGDTIHRAAERMRAVLEGRVPSSVLMPHPRHRWESWSERLQDRAVTSVDAHGKHLFLRFEGDLVVHSHLRMTGSWRVHRRGERWSRARGRAWLVLSADEHEVVQFDGPVLELLTQARSRRDPRFARLGPDILALELDAEKFLRRLRAGDPTRPIGDALLDQRVIAGIGNYWRAEACFEAGVDPWRASGQVASEEALAIIDAARVDMQRSVAAGRPARRREVYDRAGLACRRCATPILARGQGDNNRTTYWCPSCQS